MKRTFLNVEQAADFLGYAIPTLYTKVSKGQIPYYKMKGSKHLKFSLEELTELIEAGRRKTLAEVEQEVDSHLSNNKKG